MVRDLVAHTIAEGVGATVAETVRETVAAVAAVESAGGVALQSIADILRLDKSNVSRRLRVAAEGGYLRNLEDKRGKPGRWVVGDPLPETIGLLPDPAQLAPADTSVDQECCGVASEFKGQSDTPPNRDARGDKSASHDPNGRAVCADGLVRGNDRKRSVAQQAPGSPGPNTPGMTERVQQALAASRNNVCRHPRSTDD